MAKVLDKLNYAIWNHKNKEEKEDRILGQGSPTPGSLTGSSPWSIRNWVTQASEAPSIHAQDPGSVKNHTPSSAEKMLSSEPILGTQNVGVHCSRVK